MFMFMLSCSGVPDSATLFRAALFIIAKAWRQPQCPTEEWAKKMWYNGVSVRKRRKECLLQQHGWA